jgi:hypothetical protein
MKMPTKTKNTMSSYADRLPLSPARAQCYTIANYDLIDETIAERLLRDHRTRDGALRAAALMRDAGCAEESDARKHCYGTFTFEDGSKL